MKLRLVCIYACILFLYILGVIFGYIRFVRGDTITVAQVQRSLEQCRITASNDAYFHCVRRIVRQRVFARNLAVFMHYIEQAVIQTNQISSIGACHEIAHIIGEEVGKTSDAIPYLVNACDRSCGYGCTHGVIVGAIRRSQKGIAALPTLCDVGHYRGITNGQMIPCYHGAGHALAEYASYDIHAALQYCRGFLYSEAISACWTGVFMEMFIPPTQAHVSLPMPSDILTYCRSFDLDMRTVCVAQLIAAEYQQTQDDVHAFTVCLGLPKETGVTCSESVGAQVYLVTHGNIQQIVEICSKQSSVYEGCIRGALNSAILLGNGTKHADMICQSLAAKDRLWCNADMQRQYDDFNAIARSNM